MPQQQQEGVSSDDSAKRIAELEAKLAAQEAEASKVAKLEQNVAKLRQQARDRALGDARVLEPYRKFVPEDIDLTTTEGKAALEAWLEKHPAFVEPLGEPEPADIDVSKIITKDMPSSWLIDTERMKAQLAGRELH